VNRTTTFTTKQHCLVSTSPVKSAAGSDKSGATPL
jgi:hypothetical protein